MKSTQDHEGSDFISTDTSGAPQTKPSLTKASKVTKAAEQQQINNEKTKIPAKEAMMTDKSKNNPDKGSVYDLQNDHKPKCCSPPKFSFPPEMNHLFETLYTYIYITEKGPDQVIMPKQLIMSNLNL